MIFRKSKQITSPGLTVSIQLSIINIKKIIDGVVEYRWKLSYIIIKYYILPLTGGHFIRYNTRSIDVG